jgi:hypothetical protein
MAGQLPGAGYACTCANDHEPLLTICSRVRICPGRRIFRVQTFSVRRVNNGNPAYRKKTAIIDRIGVSGRGLQAATGRDRSARDERSGQSLSDSLFGSVQRIVAAERILRVWTFPQVVAAASCGNQALVRPEAGMTGCTTCRHPAATDSAT